MMITIQHKNRWITALILIPLVLGILWTGNALALGGLICVAAMLAFHEYWAIVSTCQTREKTNPVSPIPVLVISGLIAIAMTGACIYAGFQGLIAAFCANLILMTIFLLWKFPKDTDILDSFAFQVLGTVYIFLPLCLALRIQAMPQGGLWLAWILIVVFANDTCAFYVGTAWGKHKLAPAVSPKKSVEGSAAGIGGSLVFGFLFSLIFFQNLSFSLKIIPCAILLAIAGQLGDLMESAIKRRANVKDSGNLLPGHGGVLDRIDGLLMALPAAWAYLALVIPLIPPLIHQ